MVTEPGADGGRESDDTAETPPGAPGPMVGIRVVDVGVFVAGPSVGAVLADWGADVLKVEPPFGDPFRHMVSIGPQGVNPPFELDNRGKRSIGLDLSSEAGREVLERALADADVFLTNLRMGTLEALGLDPASLVGRFPRLVVATMNGFGDRGPDRDRPSYDMGGFWARSGLAAMHTVDGDAPPILRGATGDHHSAMSLTAGVCAALFARSSTGRGGHVGTSLLRNGLWGLGQDATTALRVGVAMPSGGGRTACANPVYNPYRTADGRWLWLLGLQPERHWPLVAVALDRPEWLGDERFTEVAGRRENAADLVALMDEVFATRTLAEWTPILEDAGVWWEPVLTLPEVLAHPQTSASGAIGEVPGVGAPMPAIAAPVDFDARTPMTSVPVPTYGQHTIEVLAELGYSDEEVAALREAGSAF